jgi:NAD(P)-dependent dehydrogenase (short-subunit alcohol dehydrogenase family)
VSAESSTDYRLAVVCGSDSLVGRALVSRLHDNGWRIVTIDPSGARPHPAADASIRGDIWENAPWRELQQRIRDSGQPVRAFVHAVSDFDGSSVLGNAEPAGQNAIDARIVRSAEAGAEHLLPLMSDGQGAIVFLASVLAGWDLRPGDGAFSASQAGLVALMQSLALSAGPAGVRSNAVCMGLVAAPDQIAAIPAEARGRIPLGAPATPDDIVDAVCFLLSPDARHISGSPLVVDGGESLQSWSNAPRATHYPLAALPTDNRGMVTPRFRDKVALITGAAGGLGSATARRFGAEGAALALLDRDEAAVTRLAEELRVRGVDALASAVDVADDAAMASAIAQAEEHFGRLDVLFNNAGIGSRDLSVVDMPAADWDEVITINLRGVFLGCKYGVPALMRAGGGAVVNMGSSTGRHDTITGGAAYMASKAAVEALTKSLALQVAPRGIRANTILGGIIQTPLSFRQQERGDAEQFFAEFAARIPLGRVGQPEDVAAAVAFLASDQARHITGASLLLDGGQTLRRWISAPDLDLNKESPR